MTLAPLCCCQVTEVRLKACAERMHEADVLLANLAEQRQMAEDAVTAEVLHRKQQLQDSRQACFDCTQLL